jgi:hypothetical protein
MRVHAKLGSCWLFVLLLACHGAERDADGDLGDADGDTGDADGDVSSADGDAGSVDGDGAGEVGASDGGVGGVDGNALDAGVQTSDASVTLPPANAGLDYQLGGAYSPPSGVGIVSRDRTEMPASGLYNICYVNGFQAQPDANDFWLKQHADLVLRDASNKPVIDRDWNEMLLDISSADKRARLAEIEADWIAGCARSGFDAVEIDNLDSYSRSGGRISEDHAVAFMHLLSSAAHAQGLAIAQKNASEIVGRRTEMGTDFVVSEECAHYDECDVYMRAYGKHVLLIEYVSKDFDTACSKYPDYSVVLRDRDLVPKGSSGYVYRGC